jgi:aminoglycoside phosphotransferase (APT) family kinase protein
VGENAIFAVGGGVIVRVSRTGQMGAATREVDMARWLKSNGISAVTPLDVVQPIEVEGRPVTFWCELPEHRPGRPAEVARMLRALHDLVVPVEFTLGQLDPFVRLDERLSVADTISAADRAWLEVHLAELRQAMDALPVGRGACVVHGDAWAGNVVVTGSGDVVLLDLERCSWGPPEWDLVSTAMKWTSFASISMSEYRAFCRVYGYDVTQWSGYDVLRDVRELRMCSYVLQLASAGVQGSRAEAEHRVRCLRGDRGPRPWRWTAF